VRKLVIATLLAGCYSPHPQGGAPCPTGSCPDPLVCSPATQTCETAAVDAPRPPEEAAAVDAMPDVPGGDAMHVTGHLIQQAANHADADTLTITLPQAPAAGDVLVFIGGDIHSELDASTGVAGGAVASWRRATFSAINTNVEIWVGVSAGTTRDVVIHGISGDTHAIFGNVSEWSGLATTGAMLDGAHASDGITSPADPGAIITTSSYDVAFFAVSDLTPNTFGAPGPGTWQPMAGIDADISLGIWYRLVGGMTLHPTVTETDHSWDAALAALRAPP
jgi:hypothetical protein